MALAVLRHVEARLGRPGFDRSTRRLLTDLLVEGHRGAGVSAFAANHGVPRRSLHRRLERAGVPPPSHWLRLGRLLAGTCRLRRRGDIVRAARAATYASPSAFSVALYADTGLRPGDLFGECDWRIVVDAWLDRR